MRISIALLVLLASLTAPAATGQESEESESPAPTTLLRCGWLLATPGDGPPLRDAVVLVEGDQISEVATGGRAQTLLEGGADEMIDLADRFVLPGLIDCHTHITGEMSEDYSLDFVKDSEADTALKGALYARRTLEAGFTTIRNVGSHGDAAFALRNAIDEGMIPGPRILVAGRSITPTGGHGDVHGYREDLLPIPTHFQGVADGVDGVRRAVRAQVKRGADLIKITATGGVLSATAAGTGQQFFQDELDAIVATAHMLGRKVAAHAHGADGLDAALRAGVDSIEHGSFLDDESIELMKKTGAHLVPTLLAGRTVVDVAENNPDQFPPAVRVKAMRVGPVMMGSLGKAYDAGVRIAFGTDSGVSPHGENAREFALMVEAGMPPIDAIRSATIDAADLCGLSDEIGTIEAGKSADLIAVDADPTADVTELEQVVFVMFRGEVEKAPVD